MTTSPVETPQPPTLNQAPPPERLYEYVLLGMIIVAAMATTIGYFAYHGWFTQDVSKNTASYGIGLPFLGLAAGLFAFSYGWQRGDMSKAVRMTFWLCLGSMALIAGAIAVLALLRGGGGGASSEEAEGEGEAASSSSHSGVIGGLMGHAFDESDYVGGSASRGWSFGGGTVFGRPFGNPSQLPAQSVHPNEPLVIHCPHCGERYVPTPPKAICPYCGASAFAS